MKPSLLLGLIRDGRMIGGYKLTVGYRGGGYKYLYCKIDFQRNDKDISDSLGS